MKAQRDYTKREYGTRNLKKAAKVDALEQGQEAKEQADRLKKLQSVRFRAGQASKLADLEPEQRGSTVNVLGRPGQDPAAMQAAARSAAAGGQQVSQQAATGARGRASAALGQAAAKRADMQKQALGALEYGGQPTFAEKLGQDLVAQAAEETVHTATGLPQEMLKEGAASSMEGGGMAALAMGS